MDQIELLSYSVVHNEIEFSIRKHFSAFFSRFRFHLLSHLFANVS